MIDYTLYMCTDRRLMSTATLEECVSLAIEGGVTMVQLREKELSGRDFYDMGCRIKKITDGKVPLIIDDRVDIALAVGADGVHLGQSDLSCDTVRKIVGSRLLIGVTAHSAKEAVEAERQGADYLGVGAMCATGTKSDAKVLRDGELDEIRRAVHIPIVIIGGINKDNVRRFKGRGIDGIAVVSAIVASPDIAAAARELKRIWTE